MCDGKALLRLLGKSQNQALFVEKRKNSQYSHLIKIIKISIFQHLEVKWKKILVKKGGYWDAITGE